MRAYEALISGMCGRLRVPARQVSMLRPDAAVDLTSVAVRLEAASLREGRQGPNRCAGRPFTAQCPCPARRQGSPGLISLIGVGPASMATGGRVLGGWARPASFIRIRP